jgi:integrase
MGHKRAKANYRRIVLRLPDLDHSKIAVLNSLTSPASRRVYKYAIEKFVAWYCSEPRIAFNRIVVVRYRIHLESLCLAANTINQHLLAAVRRLAHEAADAGLLSPDLVAGIARVKGVKQLGQRSGNWLTQDQSADVLRRSRGEGLRAKRDSAMLAMLFGCGLRRSELAGLEMEDIQTRQGHWAIVDLIGKAGMFERFRFLIGQNRHSMSGSQQLRLQRDEYFERLRGVERSGEPGSLRTSSGTWCEAVASEQDWSISRRTICVGRVRSCVTPTEENLSRFSSCLDTRPF